MGRPERILYVGTYERDYPRNALVIQALRHAGYLVEEIHAPVWERTRDKSQLGRSPIALLQLFIALAASYAALSVRLLRTSRRSDVVMFGYPGQLDMLTLGLLARLARRPVVFNQLVTLTDTIVEDRSLVSRRGPSAAVIGLVDRLALAIPQRILVDTPENAVYVAERFGVDRALLRHVNVGADESLFCPERWRVQRRDSGMRVLFYGKLIPLHGVDTILDAIEILRGEDNVRFEIIGSGQLDDLVRDRLHRLGSRRVAHLPWVDFEQLPGHIAAADCVLGIFGPGDKAGRVVPNKVYQAMAMGAPIITRRSPAVERILEHDVSAYLVPASDAAAMAAAILTLRDPALRRRLGDGARQAFLISGSRDALASQLHDALDGLAGRNAVIRGDWQAQDGVS